MAIDRNISRRGLFKGSAAALAGSYLGLSRGAAGAPQEPAQVALVSAARIGGVDSGALVARQTVSSFTLPARAHALTHMPNGEVLLIGRRPGTFAALVDPHLLDEGETPRVFGPSAGRRFAGHAAVSPDGRTLVTSEIDAETGEGAVVFRAAESGAVRAVHPVGIEPHDLLFAEGGARLVVAIGGIAHAAEVKGPAMNAGKIDSFIAEIDPRSGTVLKRHALPPDMKSLSLRHMALAPDNRTVAFGMQDQDRSGQRPLMGVLRTGAGIELLPLPEEEGALRSYIGSVAFDASGRYVAATSPKGGMVGLWRLSDGRSLGGFKLADVCGLAADAENGALWTTSGFGDVVRLHASDTGFETRAHWRTDAAFDNHLLRI